MSSDRRKKLWILAGGLAVGLLTAFWFCLPRPLFRTPVSPVLNDRKGNLLGAAIAADAQWRFPAADRVPDKFETCILAFEDRRFYYHPGVDPVALLRATIQNFGNRGVRSGGSTLTMQVIRLSTRHRRTYFNKLREIIMALRLELTYSKPAILALYAAHAPFGSNVVGLSAASWRYFGRRPEQLSWGEMAALAVLPNAPSLVHPGKNREVLRRKRDRLLDKLWRTGRIDSAAAALAKLEPVPDRPLRLPEYAPHLLHRIAREPIPVQPGEQGLRSTLDIELQRQVNAILERHHTVLRANHINNVAALIVEVETGAVRAYAGNIYHPGDPVLESSVDVIAAPRSPGSTLKPILYAAMLNDGRLLPNSLVADVPTHIAGYQPQNFDLGYDGAVPASTALSRSLNVPAVKMLQHYRYARLYDLLRRMGTTTLNRPADHYGLSLILGGGESSLWELTGMYASMARSLNTYSSGKGFYRQSDYHPPVLVPGTEPVSAPTERNGLLGAAAIWYMFEAMQEVMRPGEEQLWQEFTSSRRVAWKTGTSFGFRDGWAIGVTPKYAIGVWTGNTNGEGRAGLTGVATAAPVLFDLFRLLPEEKDWFPAPAKDIVMTAVCAKSGFKAGNWCEERFRQAVPRNGLKSVTCPYHRQIHVDRSEKWQVSVDCEPVQQVVTRNWFVLPPAMEYYYRARNYQYKPLPPFRADCAAAATGVWPLELIYPKTGAKVYVPLEADGLRGRIICAAAHRNLNEKLYWHLDGDYVGATRTSHQMALAPTSGSHRVTVTDGLGNAVNASFTVLTADKGFAADNRH